MPPSPPTPLIEVFYVLLSIFGALIFSVLLFVFAGCMADARHDELCQKIRDEDEWDQEHLRS